MTWRKGALLILLLLRGEGAGQTGEILSPSDGPIRLFDGRSLNGFRTWLGDSGPRDPRAVFSVTHGCIRISGDGLGYLGTSERYANYRLVAEFKWGVTNRHWAGRLGKARDSGIFLHATGPDGNSDDGQGAYMAAIECNLFQGATGDLLLIRGRDTLGERIAPSLTAEVDPARDADGWYRWKSGGQRATLRTWGRLNWLNKDLAWKDEFDFRGANDVEKPAGEWNLIECICDDRRIRIILNGVVVNEAFDVTPSRGRILLQCEGSEIYFSRLELHPLLP